MFAATVNLFAQKPIVLEFETHAIKNESNNEMKLCTYVNPGAAGANQIWNFSQIEATSNFTGYVKSSYHSVNSMLFPQVNTELNEFNNRFYFRIAENKIEQYGYSSLDNLVVTTFDKPFVKMKFPFTMGDNYQGTFSGTYKSGNSNSNISGTYEVIGDGYGRLILPGNFIVDNTLRVKTLKSYSHSISGVDQTVEIVAYRWYSDWHRYPLLVLTQVKSSANGSTSVSYQAAYNTNLSKPANTISSETKSDKLFDVYPNPTDQIININYFVAEDGFVTIELYDLAGKKAGTLFNQELKSGAYTLQPDLIHEGFVKGFYLIKVTINGLSDSQQVVLLK